MTLHFIHETLLILNSGYRTFSLMDTSLTVSLRVVWEANCSCRNAGYPESTMEELDHTWGDGSICSGLPSPMDVPTSSQAAARESAAQVLRALRQVAGRVWPDHPAAAMIEGSSGCGRSSYAEWEAFQSVLLSPHTYDCPPAALSWGRSWGEGLWCFNPACDNLEVPSELALKTFTCGGGCGVRYCSPECQAQGWRDGHRLSCGQLRDRRVACEGKAAQGQQQAPGGDLVE